MRRLRLLLARHPAIVPWLVACALAVRLLVPAGFMPVAGAEGVMLGLCPGTVATAPMHHGGGGHHDDPAPAKGDAPCAFAGLGLAALDPPVPVILLLALAFAMLLAARAAATLPSRAPVRWRPPLRAPPRAA